MARRRSAAEQVGVPELDEQEERERQEADARREAEQEEQRLAAEAEATPAAAEPAVPDWVPEKFRKDPTKFAESYSQMENRLRQESEGRRALEARIAELEAQPTYADDDVIYGVPRDQVEAAMENDPLGTQKWLAEQAASNVAQQAFSERSRLEKPGDNMQNAMFARAVNETMANEFDDWDELSVQVRERLVEDPSLLPESIFATEDPLGAAKRHLSMVYKDIKYDSLLEEQQGLRERGLQQKDIDAARKREAATLSGASGRAPEPSEAEKELAEMRAAMAGSSYGLHRAQEKRA